MNFMMMTMATQTSRARKMLNLLKRLVKQDYLYTDEKLREMKQTLKIAEEEFAALEAKNSKGFK